MLRREGLLPSVSNGLAFPVRSPNKPPRIAAIKQKGIIMKNRFVWVSALALAIGAISQVESKAAYTNSNGLVITYGISIATPSAACDVHFFSPSSSPTDHMDATRCRCFSTGDSAMCELLQ